MTASNDKEIPTPSPELGKQLFLAGVTINGAERFRTMAIRPETEAYFSAEIEALRLFSDSDGGRMRCPNVFAAPMNHRTQWTMHAYAWHQDVTESVYRCVQCGYSAPESTL